MPNQYLIYWKPSNRKNLGEEMKHASSDHFEKMSAGDTVYFVTQSAEDFLLLGKIVAGTVTDSREKVADCLGCEVEDLDFCEEPGWHIVANPKKAFTMKELPAGGLLEQIMVKSGGEVQKIKIPLSHQSFRSPRLLTTGSVRWLDEYLETEEIPEAAVRAGNVQAKRREEEREREQRAIEAEETQRGWFAKFNGFVKSVMNGERRERRPVENDSKRRNPKFRRKSRR